MLEHRLLQFQRMTVHAGVELLDFDVALLLGLVPEVLEVQLVFEIGGESAIDDFEHLEVFFLDGATREPRL